MGNLNNEPIDIVIPWVNPNDDYWFEQYSYWKTKCTGMKSPERIRDFGNFKYWFRSVEKYLPWVRYIFLVIPYKSSIPSWLNTEHPKLKIITQEDYLPAEYNPCFNSYVCTMYLHLIPGLGEHIIYSNDDMVFCKPQNECDYFENDMPVRTIQYSSGRSNRKGSMFQSNQYNAEEIIKCITGRDFKFRVWHTNFVFNKAFIAFMWHKFGSTFKKSLRNSKFRQSYNITDLVFDFAQQVTHNCIDKPVNKNTKYFGLRNNSTAEEMLAVMRKYSVVCFNDNEFVRGDVSALQRNLLCALDTMFNTKSSFEL